MRVVVTGATGFLGSRVVTALRAGPHEPAALVRPGRKREGLDPAEVLEGDLRDEPSLRRALRGAQGLVHCAVARGWDARGRAEQRAVNVEGFSALLRAAQATGIERIVHVSTLATLGATRDRRLLDERGHMDARIARTSFLGTKREAEERALAAAWAGMNVVVVNPGMLLDARAVCSRWVPPGGAGCCDVGDVAAAIVAALERGRSGERYPLGGAAVSWRELGDAIARHTSSAAPHRELPRAALPVLAALARRNGVVRRPWRCDAAHAPGTYVHADSGKAARELAYRVRPLEECVRRAFAPPENAP